MTIIRKRLAEEFRAPDAIAPGQLDGLGDADPDAGRDLHILRPRMQRDRRPVQRQGVVRDGDAERFGQLARARAQRVHIDRMAAAAHRGQAMRRLQRADQHGGGRAFLLADEVDAPVDAVGAVDIGKAGRAEHDLVPRRRAVVGVRRRLGMMIGLDLDDDPADAVDQHGRTDQVGRDLVDAAVEKAALQGLAQPWCGSLRGWSHSR